MPQTRDCDFCGSEIPPGTGTMFVRTDGTAIHYCSSKCEKNADLGREPRDVEWVQDEEAEELRRAEEGVEEEAAEDAEADEDEEAAADDAAEDADSETADDEASGDATADESGEDEAEEA